MATVTQNYTLQSEESAVISWTCSEAVDYVWYSKDNGSTYTAVGSANATSGSYTISIPHWDGGGVRSYYVFTRVRLKASQSQVTSTYMMVTGDDYPYDRGGQIAFTIGETVTIPIYNPFGRTVTVSILKNSTTLASVQTSGTSAVGFNTSANVTAMYDAIPNASAGYADVKVTYGTHVSTLGNGVLMRANNSLYPPLIGTFTYQDVNSTVTAITGNNQRVVAQKSNVQFTVTGVSGQRGASISSVKVAIPNVATGHSLTGSGTTYTGTINSIAFTANIADGTLVPATVTVTDSRGIEATSTVYMTVDGYMLPYITLTAQREGNYYPTTTIKADASCSSLNGGNSVTITYSCTKAGDQSPSITGSLTSGVAITQTLDNEYSWTISATATDALGGTRTVSRKVGDGAPMIFFDDLHTSVGLGGFPNTDNAIEVVDGYPLKMEGYHNTARVEPYSFKTNGGSNSTLGWARIARISLSPQSDPQPNKVDKIDFEVRSYTMGKGKLQVFLMNLQTGNCVVEPTVNNWLCVPRRNDHSNEPFVKTVTYTAGSSAVYDVYYPKGYTYDELTVYTKCSESLQERATITYEDDLITTWPTSGIRAFELESLSHLLVGSSASFGYSRTSSAWSPTSKTVQIADTWALNAYGKDNTFNYMPYSFSAYGAGSTSGYAKIATITQIGTYLSGPIEFVVRRNYDERAVTLSAKFSGGNTKDADISAFHYDSLLGTYNDNFKAYIYKRENTGLDYAIFDVYVWKPTSGSYIGVNTYISNYAQSRCSVSYEQELVATADVPANAVFASGTYRSTPTFTKSSGTGSVSSVELFRSGNVCELMVGITLSGATDLGGTVVQGTLSGIPPFTANGRSTHVTTNGSVITGRLYSSSGTATLNVRAGGVAPPTSGNISLAIVFLCD